MCMGMKSGLRRRAGWWVLGRRRECAARPAERRGACVPRCRPWVRAGGRPALYRASALMAHERSIAALKSAIGPHYDLAALWDKHCEYESATRNVDDTMGTMVAEPYVNHIPTMTGGVGYKALHHFYTNHFVNGNPPDTALVPISRTVFASEVFD